MDKAISTALFVIAGIIASMALINAVVPAVGRGSSALLMANSEASDRIKTDLEIIFSTGDTSTNEIVFWAKNVGTNPIKPIDVSDIFLTTPTTALRVPYTGSAAADPRWDYLIENGTEWTKTVTIKVTLHMDTLSTGLHSITMISYNSVSDTEEFSI